MTSLHLNHVTEVGGACLQRALFLDRDGVVNIDKGYVFRQEDIIFVQGIFDLCRQVKQSGYLLIIVTNQSGIARGFYSEVQFQALMFWMRGVFENEGCVLDAVYHCPFLGEHPMRKPNPGMILQAASDFNLDLGACILIGDKETDIEAGRRAGIGTNILLSSLRGAEGDVAIQDSVDCFSANTLRNDDQASFI